MPEGRSYRDELAAAHARIADLEEDVADLRAQLEARTTDTSAELERLGEKRAKLVAAQRALGGFGRETTTLVLTLAIGFTLAAALGARGLETLAFLAMSAGVVLLVARVAKRGHQRRMLELLAEVDERSEQIRRWHRIATTADPVRTRIATAETASEPEPLVDRVDEGAPRRSKL
jgi:Flp pilus assembly protein TadB